MVFLKLKRNFVFLNKISLNILNLLNFLWNIGIIKGFQLHNKNIKVFLNYTKLGKPSVNSVKFYSKYIKNKIIIKKKKFLNLNFFILIFYNKILLSFKFFLKKKNSNNKFFFLFCKFY